MSKENNHCPVCNKPDTLPSVERDDLIVMQNYVYREYDAAIDSQTGKFELRACANCGFAYNAAFDPKLLTYDENYDNLVPSTVFEDYYRQIAKFLYNKFPLENGPVIEVGCGKGAFLNIICEMYPEIEAIGMDPSYQPNEKDPPPNVRFITDIFNRSHISQKPSLILCRHVLEHIARPIDFLRSIREALAAFPGTPFFIEVPDLEWIIENNAFWDFCYEHCNYFTSAGLKNTLKIAGFDATEISKGFGGQYLWSMGTVEGKELGYEKSKGVIEELAAYRQTEGEQMRSAKDKLESLKKKGNELAVWGMSTKGVIFCNLIDPDRRLFDHCIDINQNKFNCFVPHTGHQIKGPETLTKIAAGNDLTIIVMNPNYISEIADTCAQLRIAPKFIDAAGNELPN